jgi:hypothetical protein
MFFNFMYSFCAAFMAPLLPENVLKGSPEGNDFPTVAVNGFALSGLPEGNGFALKGSPERNEMSRKRRSSPQRRNRKRQRKAAKEKQANQLNQQSRSGGAIVEGGNDWAVDYQKGGKIKVRLRDKETPSFWARYGNNKNRKKRDRELKRRHRHRAFLFTTTGIN